MDLSVQQTHRQRADLCLPRGRERAKEGLKFGISSCKLLCIEWINSKILLYSIRSCIQDHVINHNGKEYEKMCVCIYTCITESVCCIAKINTVNQLYFNKMKKILSFQKCCVREIIQYIPIWNWVFSVSIIPWSFLSFL